MPGLQAGHQHNPFVNHTLLEGPVENPKKNHPLYIVDGADHVYVCSIVSLKEHMNENFCLWFFRIIQTYIYKPKKVFE